MIQTPISLFRGLYQDIIVQAASMQELLEGEKSKLIMPAISECVHLPTLHTVKHTPTCKHTQPQHTYTFIEDISYHITLSKCLSRGTITLQTK